jgi:RimJ/RimL family protein N-acetyltransferase
MELLTERLLIRNLKNTDFLEFEKTLNNVQKTCMGSAEHFFNWIISQYTNMDVINGLISLGIFNKQTGVLLGTAGAGKHDDLHETEIFYELLPEHRGNGYAMEAVKAITNWIFENYKVPYLIATAGVDNVSSQKVLERCGYQFIDDRTLVVHIEGKKYDFKYYRFYPVV